MSPAVLITGLNGSLTSVIAARAKTLGFLTIGTTRSEDGPLSAVDVWLPGLDLTVPSDADRLVLSLRERTTGTLHVVHGAGFFGPFETMTDSRPQDLIQMVESNLTTLLVLAHAVCPLMVERGGGVLAAFSCHAVDRDYPRMVTFAAVKKAVEVVMAGLASELAGQGVVPLTFAPATIDTPVERERVPNGDVERWMHPVEVADIVLSHLLTPNPLLAGNVIHLYRHSDRYFVDGFLSRIGAVAPCPSQT